MQQLKVFTLDQANAILPKLTDLIGQLHAIRDDLSRQEVEIDALELISSKESGKSSPAVQNRLDMYNHRIQKFYGVIDEIQAEGCYLKDVDIGLIDFYGMHEGKVVYFCWRLGESEVKYWHEVGRGFAHRQPL